MLKLVKCEFAKLKRKKFMNCKLAEREKLATQGILRWQIHFKPTGKTLRR